MKEKQARFRKQAGARDENARQQVLEYAQTIAEGDGKSQYVNLDMARRRAANIRHKAIEGMEHYLVEFESNFEKNGGKVIWALDAEEANREVAEILKKNSVHNIVKTHSLLANEISLTRNLPAGEFNVVETDPGDFMNQLANRDPEHMVAPTLGQTMDVMAETVRNVFGKTNINNPKQLVEFAREKLRQNFTETEAVITGANFLIADTGSVCISENEGAALLGSTTAKIHITLAGIDSILPSYEHLEILLPLYSVYTTGNKSLTYSSLISGPRRDEETDGASRMFVVLIDNGRSDIMRYVKQRSALNCIQCGACANVCPIYQHTGGSAYDSAYPGPIGAVVMPLMKGFAEYGHLSYASTLCGSCAQVCPVNINLPDLLLYNRQDFVAEGLPGFMEKATMSGLKRMLVNRNYLDKVKAGYKNLAFKRTFYKSWGGKDSLPRIKEKSFKLLWQERREGKE